MLYNDETQMAVCGLLRIRYPYNYCDGIVTFVSRLNKYIRVFGDYVEKYLYFSGINNVNLYM
jgi:hypothetical protein